MPNIKVYGLKKKEYKNIYKKIKELFEKESYADDVVITRVKSKVMNLNDKKQPYVQLELCCTENYEDKRDKLKNLGLDIQVLKIHEFIGKK